MFYYITLPLVSVLVEQLRLGLPGGSRVAKPTKMKLFVTDGTEVGLSGACLVFMRSKMDGALTESNITQVVGWFSL